MLFEDRKEVAMGVLVDKKYAQIMREQNARTHAELKEMLKKAEKRTPQNKRLVAALRMATRNS